MQARSASQVARLTTGSSPGQNLDPQHCADPVPTHTAESQRLSDLTFLLDTEV